MWPIFVSDVPSILNKPISHHILSYRGATETSLKTMKSILIKGYWRHHFRHYNYDVPNHLRIACLQGHFFTMCSGGKTVQSIECTRQSKFSEKIMWAQMVAYSSVVKLWLNFRAWPSEVAPSSPIPFCLRLIKRVLQSQGLDCQRLNWSLHVHWNQGTATSCWALLNQLTNCSVVWLVVAPTTWLKVLVCHMFYLKLYVVKLLVCNWLVVSRHSQPFSEVIRFIRLHNTCMYQSVCNLPQFFQCTILLQWFAQG